MSSMYRSVIIVVCLAIVVVFVWMINNSSMLMLNNSSGVLTSDVVEVIRENCLVIKEPVPGEEHIIFLETKCTGLGVQERSVLLNPRQACALEAAALSNPTATVYMLHGCEVTKENILTGPEYLRILLTYPNVYITELNWQKRFQGTPLAQWAQGGAFDGSRYPTEHFSDVLRYVMMWKYGGTYLDHDVVLMRSLSEMSNFAGAESATDVAAGVLNFAHDGVGHELAEACLEDIRTHFRGNEWGHNGPGVITRVLKQVCGVQEIRDMTPERCRGFTVHPPSSFYPIPWRQWKLYFEEKNSDKTMSKLNESLAIHVWNRFSVAGNITVGSQQPYGLIAQKYCPKVYSHCGQIF